MPDAMLMGENMVFVGTHESKGVSLLVYAAEGLDTADILKLESTKGMAIQPCL
jgi:hypothetical protein